MKRSAKSPPGEHSLNNMPLESAGTSVGKAVAKQPKTQTKAETSQSREDSLQLASSAYVQQKDALVDPILLQPLSADPQIRVQDLLLSELNTARMLNLEMTERPEAFMALLNERIKEITGTQACAILILDEESGTYRCLMDEAQTHVAMAPREVTWISDLYLQELLGCDQVIHSFLQYKGAVLGIVAVANKQDGSRFSLRDELILEQLSPYLSVQVNHYLMIKQATVLPAMQQILLKLSSRLLSAVDSPAIFQSTLETLVEMLPFSAGQFIQLDRQTGLGYVVYQMSQKGFSQGMPLFTVETFSSMMSLFQSQVWSHQYLYFKGKSLGDKPFEQIFGLDDIVSVLVLPMMDGEGQVNGALALFQQDEQIALSKEALGVLEQASELIVAACARAHVLEKALEIATTDELTETLNRRGFYGRFEAEVERARRNLSPMSLAMIDVDYFKQVNDTFGHLAGDQILKDLARMLEQNLRRSDLLCRFGGEEFVVLLPETSTKAAMDLIDRLRLLVQEMVFITESGPIQITFSAGVADVETTQQIGADVMQIISHALAKADEAMYDAKHAGRNCVTQYED